MKRRFMILFTLLLSLSLMAYDWAGVPIPAAAGAGKKWQLQKNVSDDFNYRFDAKNHLKQFGGKWTNYYHNSWEGPGPTKWVHENVSVSGTELEIIATRKDNEFKTYPTGLQNPATDTKPATRAGCITSVNRVKYPVFIEARVKIANAVMASDVWLLSPDDTQEIDIIEAYGGAGEDNRNWFSQFIHLSHHTFIRNPFQDYQPADRGSWYAQNGITAWGKYPQYVRVGVYWKNPTYLEYYIDGRLVRILSDKAFAWVDKDGVWHYTYPSGMTNGKINKDKDGYQEVIAASSLAQAKALSNTSVIDPYNFTGGSGLSKAMDIIINMEDQNWNAYQGRTPTNSEIKNHPEDHKFKVDWIRAYVPVPDGSSGNDTVTIEAENFKATGGTFNDSFAGGPGLGVKKSGSIINYVNNGDWVEYQVSIPKSGAYEIVYTLATPDSGSTIAFSVSGTLFNTTYVTGTGGWGTYQKLTASQTANFTAGNHLIRLTAGSADWTWNLDRFTLRRVSNR